MQTFPTFFNFLPADTTFTDIMEQQPPQLSEVGIAFPMQYQWQKLEELVVHDKSRRFIANPPAAPVPYERMTPVQQHAVDVGVDFKQQILLSNRKSGLRKNGCSAENLREVEISNSSWSLDWKSGFKLSWANQSLYVRLVVR
jgi:hypothetical protein